MPWVAPTLSYLSPTTRPGSPKCRFVLLLKGQSRDKCIRALLRGIWAFGVPYVLRMDKPQRRKPSPGKRAITESFRKSELHEPNHFCDLCRNVPRHGNSDHLMSFKQEFLTLSISVICAGDVLARKSFLSLHFLTF